MADQADVARALEDVADAVRVAQGATWTVYRGYPEAAALDAEIKAGDVHVTVNPRPGGFTRNTTRYLQQDAVTVRPVPSLTVAVDGDTATFGGTADPGQAAGVQVGHAAWVTRTQAGDTPPAVASGLAALVPGASAAGATLTVPGLTLARIGADATVSTILRNTEQQFTLTVWCADPDTRDAVAASLDAALSALTFLPLPGNEAGRIRFAGDQSSDKAESASIYTRMLHYSIDYPTTRAAVAPTLLFPGAILAGWQLPGGAPQTIGATAPP